MHHFIIDIIVMSDSVQTSYSLGLEFWAALVEALRPVLAGRSNIIVRGRNLEGGGTLAGNHHCERT
jgi:hypothetical protein